MACFVGGVVLAGAGVCGGWAPGLLPAGLLLVVAGATALLGGRSAVVPRGLRVDADLSPDPDRRAAAERAGALMSGMMLVVAGVVLTALGVAALL